MSRSRKRLLQGFLFITLSLMLITAMMFFYESRAYASELTVGRGDTLSEQTDISQPNISQGEMDFTSSVTRSDDGSRLSITYNNDATTLSAPLRIMLILTIISLAPSILVMLTSFTRIIVVLHFVRQAVGTQTSPPNQVLTGLALFLTLFIMAPIFTQINETAIKPLDAGEITQQEALQVGMEPIREFMFSQTKVKDISLFIEISGETYEDFRDVPNSVLIPSFILSELRAAFIIGFLIYIPFIVIDMVVSSVLMSMGMMMLPPTTISLPFKILLFILADGWELVIGGLVKTFY